MHLRFFMPLSFFVLLASLTAVGQKPELVVQTGHSSSVLSVAISPDGKTLASGSEDNTIKLWDLASGKQLYSLNGHSNRVKSVVFSPDGVTLATVSGDYTFKLWDLKRGVEVRSFKSGDLKYPESVAISPDGKILAGGAYDTIKLWDLSTGDELRSIKVDVAPVSLAFSPDGKTLACGIYQYAILFDVTDGKEILRLKHTADYGHEVSCVTFSPNGKTLASAGEMTIKLWDVAHGSELRTLTGHTAPVSSVVFALDGKTLASGSEDKTIRLWDPASGNELRMLTPKSQVYSVAFSPDGATLASGTTDPSIRLWKVADGTELSLLVGHSSVTRAVALSPNGMTLASGLDNSVILWDMANANGLRILNGHSGLIHSLAFSPDGKMLASGSDDHTIKLWGVATGKELHTLQGHSNDVRAVAFSPNGKVLASGSLDVTIRLWDVASGNELKGQSPGRWQDDEFEFSTLTFSTDGRVLAAGIADGTINLWDVSNETELRSINANTTGIQCVAFSPDRKTVATGRWNSTTVQLWDVTSRKELRTLKGHSEGVRTLAFSEDGKTLASGGDAFLKLWHMDDGRELASLVILDRDNWFVSTPTGLFDGSPGAWKQVLWRFNNNTFDHAPVEAFFNEFYYPGLLADIFAGKNPKAPSDILQRDRRQPQLKLRLTDSQANPTLTARNLTVKIDVAGLATDKDNKTGSGAQDVRLFRNGSLVKVWRGDVLKGKSTVTLDAMIPIVAGPNNFTAYAFNHDNIKSSDATLTVTGADSLKRKGTLRILAAGVSKYANPEYDLNYTTDDATSFATQLKLQQEKLTKYQSVEITTLLNDNATKENILAELKKLAATVQPEDAVVVYFSGHGKASGDHFYLVPHDLGYTGSRDQLSAEGLKAILAHSISDLELEEAFRDIDAGQMFMIIDACNSGQALENKDEPRRGPMNTRGLAQLAYEKGMYIMTASQNVEEAFVSERLKHSYLTFALVEEGLKTKAPDADHNGEVTLREWFDYALARVPKLREETLQSKSLDEVNPTVKAAAQNQKSQTPQVFYRRETDSNPLVVAVVGAMPRQ
jgi:WD40 repeat protein